MRGGKREGAGRKQGAPNRMSAEAREAAQAGGITPLDYMLGVLRSSTDPAARMDAAKAAAPYVHPRLAAIEHTGDLELTHHDDARTVIAGLLSELAGGDTSGKA